MTLGISTGVIIAKPILLYQEDNGDFLNQVRIHKKRQYFVGAREKADELLQDYVDKIRAGIHVPPEDCIAGVLCVGNHGNRVVEANLDLFGDRYLNLAGKTDLTCDPMHGQKPATQQQSPRERVEPMQTVAERRCTALDAWALYERAFAHNKHGKLVIHCEHGLHRSTAYAQGLLFRQCADRIVMDHFESADPDQQHLTLDMKRLIHRGFGAYYKTFGKPPTNKLSDPNAVRPYTKILRVFKKLTNEVYSDIPPALPRPYRQGVIDSRIAGLRAACCKS